MVHVSDDSLKCTSCNEEILNEFKCFRLSGSWLLWRIAVTAVGTVVAAGTVSAQAYPLKSIRLLVGYPPGGGADVAGRIIALPLGELLGRTLVVENRAGAGGNIAAEALVKAPPDGHTLLLANASLAYNVTLYKKLSFDVIRDLAPIALTAETPNIMVVHPALPVKSVNELIALAKARPAQVDYVSGGIGSPSHLAAALFVSMTHVALNHIAYKGGPPSLIGLMSGEGSVGFPTLATAMPHVTSGKLRGIAVTSAKRSVFASDLPTISEAGVNGYEAGSWYGLLAPARTPADILARLHAETIKALTRQDVKQRLAAAGLEPLGGSSADFGAYIQSEIAKWAKVIKAAGIPSE